MILKSIQSERKIVIQRATLYAKAAVKATQERKKEANRSTQCILYMSSIRGDERKFANPIAA